MHSLMVQGYGEDCDPVEAEVKHEISLGHEVDEK